jgi:hypothetical protein
MVDAWFCLYIGVFWRKISQYFAPIIHILLFYQPFEVQKLVIQGVHWGTVLCLAEHILAHSAQGGIQNSPPLNQSTREGAVYTLAAIS